MSVPESDLLEIGFAAWLSTLDAFTELAGGRVYPQLCTEPGGPVYPLAVYRRLGTQRRYNLGAQSALPTATLELICWGLPGPHGYAQAKRLAAAVRPHLSGWGDADGSRKWGEVTVSKCLIDDEADVLEQDENKSPHELAQGVRFVLRVVWSESVKELPRTE